MRRFHRAQHHLPDLVATIKQGPRCNTAWDFPRWRWEEPELPHDEIMMKSTQSFRVRKHVMNNMNTKLK